MSGAKRPRAYEDLLKGLGTSCHCPKAKAFDNDIDRVEAYVCNLPTHRYKSSSSMTTKELIEAAKSRKLVTETSGMERAELKALLAPYDECAICLEVMNDQAFVKTWTCGHIFHLSCCYEVALHRAAEGSRKDPIKCPLCRNPLSNKI